MTKHWRDISGEERAAMKREAERRMRAGEAVSSIYMDLGISVSTLHRWAKEGGFRNADIATERSDAMTLPPHHTQAEGHLDAKARAEALPETSDISDLRLAAQKAGQLAARYQLIGEVGLADAQVRLAERFVKLAEGLKRLGVLQEPEAREQEPLEDLRATLFRRLEDVAGVEYMKVYYAEQLMGYGAGEALRTGDISAINFEEELPKETFSDLDWDDEI